MVTAAVPQSWLSYVAASHPATSALLEISFTSSYALTAALALEASLQHTLPVRKHTYTCTLSSLKSDVRNAMLLYAIVLVLEHKHLCC